MSIQHCTRERKGRLEVFTVFRKYKLRLNHLEVAVKKLQSSYLAIIIFFRIISRLLDWNRKEVESVNLV